MLTELVVQDLGVIAEPASLLGPGLTALTGETGAGKTLLVEAIDLLVGGRADAVARAAGRGRGRGRGPLRADGEDELVLRRVVPADGRSRAYVDGRLATVAELAEHGRAAGRPARPARPPEPAVGGRPSGPRSTASPPSTSAPLARGPPAHAGRRRGAGRARRRRRGARPRGRPAPLPGRRARRGRRLDDPDEDERLEAEEDALAGVRPTGRRRAGALAALGDDGARDALAVADGCAGRPSARSAAAHDRLRGARRSSSTTRSPSCGPAETPGGGPGAPGRGAAPAASSCTSCAASTATRWPRSSRTAARPSSGWPSWRPTTSGWPSSRPSGPRPRAAEAAAAERRGPGPAGGGAGAGARRPGAT